MLPAQCIFRPNKEQLRNQHAPDDDCISAAPCAALPHTRMSDSSVPSLLLLTIGGDGGGDGGGDNSARAASLPDAFKRACVSKGNDPCREPYDGIKGLLPIRFGVDGQAVQLLAHAIALRGQAKHEEFVSVPYRCWPIAMRAVDAGGANNAAAGEQPVHDFQLFVRLVKWLADHIEPAKEPERPVLRFCVCVGIIDVRLQEIRGIVEAMAHAERMHAALHKIRARGVHLRVNLRLAQCADDTIGLHTFAQARGWDNELVALQIESSAFAAAKGEVNLSRCTALETIGSEAFKKVDGNVDLSGCTALTTIGNSAFMSAAGNVDLSGCKALTEIGEEASAFASAAGSVNLSGCKALTEIGDWAFKAAQGNVNLSGCEALTTIGDWAFKAAQGNVDFSGCKALVAIGDMEFRFATGSVNLSGCKALTTIGDWAFLSTTDVVNLSDCEALTTIGKAAFHSAVGDVNLSGCKALTEIGNSAFFSATGDVNLSGCEALTAIGIAAFRAATGDVNLSGCEALTAIRDSAFKMAVGDVNLSGCKALNTIEMRAFASAAGTVDLSGCGALGENFVPKNTFPKATTIVPVNESAQ